MTRAAFLIKSGLLTVLAGGTAFTLASWRAGVPPGVSSFSLGTPLDPVQSEIDAAPFDVERFGQRYRIAPRYEYSLSGLIVSQHDSSSWLDISHAKWGDFLNTKDVCVIWGENLSDRLYTKLSFSSGNWTCYVKSGDLSSWQAFRADQLSNNHILPANAEIADKLAALEVGDEILIKGKLVDYQIGDSPPRRSSTVRSDTGNGACEIVWAEELSVLGNHNRFWTRLRALAQAALLAGLALIAAGFVTTLWPNTFGQSESE